MKNNLKTLYYLIVTFLILGLISCKGKMKTDENTLVVGIDVNPTNLDPRFSLDAASSKVMQLIFNGLLRRDKNFNLVPDLAERFEQTGSLTYIFYLKKNVIFHNGKKFTAKDVAFTINSILSPDSKSAKRSSFDKIKQINIIDDFTIEFSLKETFAPFLDNMIIGIVPNNSLKENFSESPVGTGPFKFKEWILDERITLISNKDYFDNAPKLNGVILRIIPDETIRLLELEKGDIDFLQNSVPPDFLVRVKKNKRLKMDSVIGTNFSYMGFNMEDELAGDARVRMAISHAIDREKIIKYILKDEAVSATGLISPLNRFYESNVVKFDFNPALAKKLLDEAGLKDPDGDGPLFRFKIVYKTSQNELRKLIAEVIQDQLSMVGIEVIIKSFEWGTFFSDIKSGNFQAYTLTWVGISDPDIYHYIFHSKSIPPNGANRGRYKNESVDILLDKGRVESNFEKRYKLYSKVQQKIAKDAVYVNLWYSKNTAVMKKEIMGFVVFPDEGFYSMKDVYIDK